MRIGIFGGSFNPVHAGHVGIAKRAIASLALDRLIVVPAFVSPFKVGKGDGVSFSPERRLAMVRAAFSQIPEAVIDDREIKRGGVSYTVDTVRAIAAENPGAELHLLMGEDAAEGLPRWRNYEELKRLCRFAVFPRTPESSTEIRRRIKAAGRVAPNAPLDVW